ncbi:hypothetical protein MMC18_008888 [Xylographa bjoerkii]|nr:hypothetical protein [Xylographa bjoerkii]MCJ1395993.1 hypothetical protein [Xylographa bjoerkii]MCJ1396002.1 hypothetical protein [Xylographa bjoerkii]
MATSPFAKSTSNPGQGTIHLTLLPPATPTYSTLNYAYPLKLLPSTPHVLPASEPRPSEDSLKPTQPIHVPLLFLLSYGGGLLPPDSLSITLTLDPLTRLTITTQGSTKIFPSPQTSPLATAAQTLHTSLGCHSGLLIAPDPTQPFDNSRYVQKQVFEIADSASLGVLDWISEGRRARGEKWGCRECRLGCEVWRVGENEQSSRTLLLRDNILLSSLEPHPLARKMDNLGLFGTLILVGPLFISLGNFFVDEFNLLPRIGGRDWGDRPATTSSTAHPTADEAGKLEEQRRVSQWRRERWREEKEDGVLWTAARVRGCIVVKFGAREVEGGRRWLGLMWKEEGTVGREFGEGGLMCVR